MPIKCDAPTQSGHPCKNNYESCRYRRAGTHRSPHDLSASLPDALHPVSSVSRPSLVSTPRPSPPRQRTPALDKPAQSVTPADLPLVEPCDHDARCNAVTQKGTPCQYKRDRCPWRARGVHVDSEAPATIIKQEPDVWNAPEKTEPVRKAAAADKPAVEPPRPSKHVDHGLLQEVAKLESAAPKHTKEEALTYSLCPDLGPTLGLLGIKSKDLDRVTKFLLAKLTLAYRINPKLSLHDVYKKMLPDEHFMCNAGDAKDPCRLHVLQCSHHRRAEYLATL